jgi:hypothetical protein
LLLTDDVDEHLDQAVSYVNIAALYPDNTLHSFVEAFAEVVVVLGECEVGKYHYYCELADYL